MTAIERLEQAWVKAGYPREHMPRQQFVKVADYVAAALERAEEDCFKSGWKAAGVDFPFAPAHPRYQAMLEAYRDLSGEA